MDGWMDGKVVGGSISFLGGVELDGSHGGRWDGCVGWDRCAEVGMGVRVGKVGRTAGEEWVGGVYPGGRSGVVWFGLGGGDGEGNVGASWRSKGGVFSMGEEDCGCGMIWARDG